MKNHLAWLLCLGCQLLAKAVALLVCQDRDHDASDPWLHMQSAVPSLLPHGSIPEQHWTGSLPSSKAAGQGPAVCSGEPFSLINMLLASAQPADQHYKWLGVLCLSIIVAISIEAAVSS